MDLATIVLRFGGRRQTRSDDALCRAFAAHLNISPECDAESVRQELLDNLGYVPGRTVTLVEQSAQYVCDRPPIDPQPLIDEARNVYLKHLDQLIERLQQSTIVKGFIPPKWIETLTAKLQEWDVRKPLTLPDHILFLAYSEDLLLYRGESDMIETLDTGITRLRAITNKTFNDKLKALARSRESFIPTVFELLVLSPFANANRIVAYEPRISSGVPEARVQLGGEDVLIEARAKMEHQRGGGAFNPTDMGHVLAGKAREKYAGQLAGATEPVILFLSLDAYVIQDIEPEAMLAELLKDRASRVLSAIVFAQTYRAKQMRLWLHPDAHRPLSESMVKDLSLLFQLSEVMPSGYYLARK